MGGKFPEVRDSIAALDIQDTIIDGEIVALDERVAELTPKAWATRI